jgi:hypothetical protein
MSSNEIILSSHRPDDGSGTVTINVDALTSEIRDANGRPLAPPIEPPITKANVDTQVVT